MKNLTKISFAIGLAATVGLFSISIVQAGDEKAGKEKSQGNKATEPWTDWLDRDNPSGKGDYETVKDFLIEGLLDSQPIGIQCRTVADKKPWTAAKQVYSCDAAVGGVCVNSKQVDGAQCLDYEVRFRYQPNKP